VNSQANLDGDGQLRPVDAAQRDRFWWWVLAAAAGFVVLIGLAFFVVPVVTISERTVPDVAAARGTVRGNALQAVGAIAIGVGLMLTARSVTIATRSLTATREAHLGDRVVHVIELLESEEIAVRVGGVYSLERIAEQAPWERQIIFEVLKSHVHEQTPPRPKTDSPAVSRDSGTGRADADAALTVLNRWPWPSKASSQILDGDGGS